MNRLQELIEIKKVNNSRTREVVYKIIMQSDACLSVSQILEKSCLTYPKQISINTVYRHLRFFLECEIVFIIQDDFKKAYYCVCRDRAQLFNICPKCNSLKKLEATPCEQFADATFITIHKKCENCR